MTLEQTPVAPSAEEFDVDKTLAEIEAPKGDRLQSEPSAPPQEAAPDAWKGDEWAFDWNGRKIVPDSRDKVMTWASQGYNYSQRMGELNKRFSEFDQTRSEWEPKIKKYSEVDEYIAKNPDWWAHVEQSWAEKNNVQVSPELEPVLRPIQEKLSQFEQFLEKQQQREQQEVIAKQDQALETEIKATRDKFPNIDFSAVDGTGEALELRVLKHANATGIPTFRAALLDYMSDRLPDLYRAEGREAVAKAQAQAAKSGVLGRTPAPTKGLAPASNVRAKSWDQLASEAKSELGII